MKKILPTAMLLCGYVAMWLIPPVFAQTPPPGFTPTCDPCGFCVGGTKPTDWDDCVACLDQEDKTWTILGCIPTSPGGFVQTILQTVISVAGGIAFLAFLFGGFTLLTSRGDVRKIIAGKSMLISSIVGLLLIIFSIFILRLIGYEILKIPGFGG